VAGKAVIVPIRVCDSTAFIWNFHVARGLAWAIAKNCDVVSMSVGGFLIPGFHDIAEIAHQKNMLLIAAAGNCVDLVVYPARFSQCLAVGASRLDNGYWAYGPSDSRVDVAAPGDDVRTTWIDTTKAPLEYKYNEGSGTSYSAAYTAGVAALWLGYLGTDRAKIPGQAQDSFSAAVKRTATLPSGWPTTGQGAGILNAWALLQATATGPTAPGQPAPSTALSNTDQMLKDLTDMLYQGHGRGAPLVPLLRTWFNAPNDREAVQMFDGFGIETINILIADAADCRNSKAAPAATLSPDSAKVLFIRRGSNALRQALTP
jgi:hypothetical protein